MGSSSHSLYNSTIHTPLIEEETKNHHNKTTYNNGRGKLSNIPDPEYETEIESNSQDYEVSTISTNMIANPELNNHHRILHTDNIVDR